MLKVVTIWYCDACGKKIDGYKGRIELTNPNEEVPVGVGLDFCKDCMASFIEWKKSRKGRIRRIER